MSFPQALATAAARIDALHAAALARLPASRVRDAMAHALVGGKGLRGFLVLESCALHGIAPQVALDCAAAIEAMHAYSLVHDDLPAMDNDDLRRGRPTVHVAFGEATAILAGDALQALAFQLCARSAYGGLVERLAIAAGAEGMVLGQALDIAAETSEDPLTLSEITRLQQGKTGALFGWSCTVGPVLAGDDTGPLGRYAGALGLAFQIADDILDHEGDEAIAGKRLNKDAAAGKATFVSLLGLEAARARAADLIVEACDALASYGPAAESLRGAARFVISRDK